MHRCHRSESKNILRCNTSEWQQEQCSHTGTSYICKSAVSRDLVCVHMCAYTGAHIVYVLMHTQGSVCPEAREHLQVSQSVFCLIPFRRDSHWLARTKLVVSKPTGYRHMHTIWSLLHGIWGFELVSSCIHSKCSYLRSHFSSPITWHLHACVFPLSLGWHESSYISLIASNNLSGADINIYSVNLSPSS